MRFKEFIVEKAIVKWTSKSIKLNDAIELLNKHCKDGLTAVSNNGILYRGFKHSSKAMVIDASTGERTSKDTNNLYQLMMDNSTALVDYPKRSKSLICTSKLWEAESYGRAAAIIPFDGTKIVCSDEDDFISSDPGDLVDHKHLDDMSDVIEIIFDNTGFRLNKKSRGQYTDIALLDEHVKNNREAFIEEWQEYFGSDITKYVGSEKPFTELSSKLMTPDNLGIYQQKFGEHLNNDTECWFSGPCVAIDVELFAEIVEELKRMGHKVGKRIDSELTTARTRYD